MHFSIRLSKLHRWALYLVWTVLSITGLYFAYTQDWMMQDPSDLSVYTLKVHGIFAAFMLIIFGSLLSVHIKLSLSRKKNLKTGITILIVMLILIFSGTGLYYSPENWNHNVKLIHIWIGIFTFILLPIHILVGHSLRKNKNIIKNN